MASEEQVKFYLAYWFQLGKRVVLSSEGVAVIPQPVFTFNKYSATFENYWKQLIAPENRDSYLEGTMETIDELLSSQWDISPCARCNMPVAIMDLGIGLGDCPCHDLMGWPNQELPTPRSAIDPRKHIKEIQERISKDNC